ncbi:MAG TPA: SpoIIE family protein phosphatase [Polyangiaceae bacterium]
MSGVAKRVSKLAHVSAGRRERFARSFQVFLLGVIIACGIEVAVDWHSTLGDIRVLRARVTQRGESYAAVLVHPLGGPVALGDVAEVGRLVDGVFDDRDVVFVRVVSPDQKTLYERIDPAYATWFEGARHQTFDAYYAHQLDRDTKGVMTDADGLRARMEGSRHRDIAQSYQDLLVSLHVASPDQTKLRGNAVVLFQDRLYTFDKKSHDDAVTYALGKIEGGGAIVVGFDMRETNAAIRAKYLKGAGMVLFFVMLILVQNVGSRREKLRLLDLESKYASAKESIRNALPAPIETSALRVAGAIAQSVGSVDGMLFDAWSSDDTVEIVLVDPEGDGVEAAAVALHVRATYRHRREDSIRATLVEELAALGSASRRIPGERPLGAVIVRVRGDGSIEGVRCGMSAPRVVHGTEVRALDERDLDEAAEGLTPPMRAISGALGAGELLVFASDGLGGASRRIDPNAVASFVARTRASATTRVDLASLASDATTWARGTSAETAQDDILVVLAERT